MSFRQFTMYDSVTVAEIPANAPAGAGYVDGQWPTFLELTFQHLFAHKPTLSIATNPAHNAHCLDVERGDATIADAPGWYDRQKAAGAKRPAFYTSVSNWPALQDTLRAAGIKRGLPGFRRYKRFSAHYTYIPHRCSRKCGMPGWTKAGATQYTDKALGRNLDASLCARDFLR